MFRILRKLKRARIKLIIFAALRNEAIMIAGVLHFRQLNPLNRGVAQLGNAFRTVSVKDPKTRAALPSRNTLTM